MSVEILLLADVEGLGAEGDVVKVSDGYARNFLFPRKIGAPVTEATRRRLAKMQKERAAARQAGLEAARNQAAELAKGSYTITVKTGTEDKLFGSVTNGDIAKVLQTQGFEIDKNKILLDDSIKALGVYDVKIKLHPDVEAIVKVWIVEE